MALLAVVTAMTDVPNHLAHCSGERGNPPMRRQPLLQTARPFGERSPAQTPGGGQILLQCWAVLEQRPHIPAWSWAGCHLQKGLGFLPPLALSGQAGTERKTQTPFLVGVGIPRKREPVASSFTVDCLSSPLRPGSYL